MDAEDGAAAEVPRGKASPIKALMCVLRAVWEGCVGGLHSVPCVGRRAHRRSACRHQHRCLVGPPTPPPPALPRAHHTHTLSGALQCGLVAWGLFVLSTNVDAYFSGQSLPSQYTARNITVTVQTIVRGLSYLCCFIFSANAVGCVRAGSAGCQRWRSGGAAVLLP